MTLQNVSLSYTPAGVKKNVGTIFQANRNNAVVKMYDKIAVTCFLRWVDFTAGYKSLRVENIETMFTTEIIKPQERWGNAGISPLFRRCCHMTYTERLLGLIVFRKGRPNRFVSLVTLIRLEFFLSTSPKYGISATSRV